MSQSNALRLAVLAGDGVGPEITAATVEILQAAAARANLPLDLEELPIGYKSYNKWKSTLTDETVQKLRGHTGWILGPTFAGEYPKDDPIRGHPSGYLRKNFGLFANVRPNKAWPQLNPLIPDLDVTVIRENTQGFYPDRNMFWGYGEFLPTADVGLSVRVVTKPACDRFARFSLEYATALEYESLSILHKRTALPQTEGLFIGAFEALKAEFPKVKTEVVRVDTFSSSLPRDYKKYRLVATTNLFGDIASDQASGLAGGVAVAPSLNAGTDQAMAQAVHGTAPDIEGQNIANPTALALSTAMLLRWFDQKKPDQRCRDTAGHIERGIHGAREAGALTRDLGGRTSTTDFTRAVVKAIEGR